MTVLLSFLLLFVSNLEAEDETQGVSDKDTVITQALPDSVSTGPKRSRRTRRSARKSFQSYFTVSEYYDNNIFDYSDAARSEFDSLTSRSSKYPIKNLADYVTSVGLRVDYCLDPDAKWQWHIRGRYDANLYARNHYRDYNQWGLELRSGTRSGYATFAFRWLPKYNLRTLYWRKMPQRPTGVRYAAADFSRLSYSLELAARFSTALDGRLALETRRNNYVFPFDERDNTTRTAEAQLTLQLSRRWETYLQVNLGQTAAAGKDSVSGKVEDVSNNESSVEAGIQWKVDHRGRVVASTSAAYDHQRYTTGKLADTHHYRRIDNEFNWDIDLSWRLHRLWQPEIFYKHRRSTSSTPSSAIDVGSFSGYRLGLQLVHYF